MNRVLLVFILMLSAILSFGQDEEQLHETYFGLIEKQRQYQSELISNTNYFEKVRSENYVLNGSDLIKINELISRILVVLDQSVAFDKTNIHIRELHSHHEFNAFQEHLHSLMNTQLRIESFRTLKIINELLGNSFKLNKLINEENRLYREKKNSLKRISKKIISEPFRLSIVDFWTYANSIGEQGPHDTMSIKLINEIKASDYYKKFLESPAKIQDSRKQFDILVKQQKAFDTKFVYHNLHWDIAFGISKIFGNTTGLIASRKGKLLNNDDFIIRSMKSLEPLDVILDKTPFRLTDRLIPGFWGHAAMYVGNESQLRVLGIWEHPFIARHHNAIKKGYCIIEAIRSDVRIASFKQFSNVDDYAQIRLTNEPSTAKKGEMIVRAFAQIGKKYDFSFDVESSEKLVCTELPYITFDQITFSTTNKAGINTLSIDQLAEEALQDCAFRLITLYLDGIRIESPKMQEIYTQLLKLKNSEIRKYKRIIRYGD